MRSYVKKVDNLKKLPGLIGVCLSTIYNEDRFNFIKAMNRKAVEKGYRLLVFNSGTDLYEQNNADNEGAASVFRLIPYKKLSALIIFPNFIYNELIISEMIENCRKYNIPVISVDKKLDGCLNVAFSYGSVFEQICRHVIEVHGARKLFMMTGYKENKFSDDRTAAFRRALEANGIPFDENNVGYGEFWEGPAKDVLCKWFEVEKRELPDAIICANDTMAITVSSYLQRKGFKIPDDCIVTGFDGIEQASFHIPHLTTCIQDYDSMCSKITEMIEAVRKGEEPEKEYIAGFNIIYGQSCGCQTINDSNVNLAIQTLIDRMRRSSERQNMMCTLQSSISKMSDISQLPSILIDKFQFHTAVFAINDDIFNEPDFGADRKGKNSFSENVFILHQKYYWEDHEKYTIKSAELMPRYDILAEHEEPIIVCSAHFIDMVLGYCIFQTDIDVDEYQKIHTFMSAIGAALGNFHGRIQIRKINEKLMTANDELHILSRRDFMTCLFNRRGFFEMFKRNLSGEDLSDSNIVVISADLDELKDTSKNLSFQQKSCPEIGSYLKNSSKMVNEYAFRAV